VLAAIVAKVPGRGPRLERRLASFDKAAA